MTNEGKKDIIVPMSGSTSLNEMRSNMFNLAVTAQFRSWKAAVMGNKKEALAVATIAAWAM